MKQRQVTGNDDNMRLRSTTGKRQGFGDCSSSRREPVADARDGESPFLVEFFMVQGVGFRCMAWLGYDGKWRTAFDNKILPGMIRVMS
jgi:hypothetical protein